MDDLTVFLLRRIVERSGASGAALWFPREPRNLGAADATYPALPPEATPPMRCLLPSMVGRIVEVEGPGLLPWEARATVLLSAPIRSGGVFVAVAADDPERVLAAVKGWLQDWRANMDDMQLAADRRGWGWCSEA
jgi:hypothetical protein